MDRRPGGLGHPYAIPYLSPAGIRFAPPPPTSSRLLRRLRFRGQHDIQWFGWRNLHAQPFSSPPRTDRTGGPGPRGRRRTHRLFRRPARLRPTGPPPTPPPPFRRAPPRGPTGPPPTPRATRLTPPPPRRPPRPRRPPPAGWPAAPPPPGPWWADRLTRSPTPRRPWSSPPPGPSSRSTTM